MLMFQHYSGIRFSREIPRYTFLQQNTLDFLGTCCIYLSRKTPAVVNVPSSKSGSKRAWMMNFITYTLWYKSRLGDDRSCTNSYCRSLMLFIPHIYKYPKQSISFNVANINEVPMFVLLRWSLFSQMSYFFRVVL